jgi:hypothetical protein
VLGGDRRALDQRQQIALHAFAADIGAARILPGADLVDLVEKDDAVLLDRASAAVTVSSSSSLSASSRSGS